MPTRLLLAVFCTLSILLIATPWVGMADEEPAAPKPETKEEVDAHEPHAFAPSWRDRGEAAYGRKEYSDAIFHYRRWLEADPKDQTTLYNLACCYALIKDLKKAVETFEIAVDAGWSDTEHPLRDPDLEPIRENARFKAALKRCADAKGAEGPKDHERHWVKIPALGSYIVALPPGHAESEDTYPLVVILHGNGSSELNHGRLADAAGREGVIYVAPRAPYPHQQVFMGSRRPGWTWAPQDAQGEALSEYDPAAMYVDSILACVADARKRYPVKGKKVYVFGHSMGGFFANTMAVLHPEKVAAYFAYAGGLDDEYKTAEYLKPLAENGVKAWLVHGKADTVVPPSFSQEAFKLMTEHGVQANLHLYENVGHGIQEPIRELLKLWVKTIVR